MGTGDEGIGAGPDVEHRALGALEQHPASAPQGVVQQFAGVRHQAAERPGQRQRVARHPRDVARLARHGRRQQRTLGRQADLQALAEIGFVQGVGQAHPRARRAVGIGRPDPALGGPDLAGAQAGFRRLVERRVTRQDQVRLAADPQAPRPGGARQADGLQLLGQLAQVQHHPAADQVQHPRPQDARRQDVKDVLAAGMINRVAGIVPALEPDDHVGPRRQGVHDFALAFVAPLRPDNRDRRHE